MELKLIREYRSIKSINAVSLPDFTILTGLNGSGKTQILRGIYNGSIEYGNIPTRAVSFLSLEDLMADQLKSDRVKSSCKKFYMSFDNQIREIYQRNLARVEADVHHFIIEEGIDKALFSISEEEVSDELWNKIKTFKNSL